MLTTGDARSLQGSLEAFPLPDVLHLLALTHKTGHLVIERHEQTGALWLDEGRVAAAAVPADEPVPTAPSPQVLFELLRHPEGSFAFAGGVPCPISAESTPVEVLLEGAQDLLGEWREIQAVVPSLRVMVLLRAELDAGEAIITADQWRLVVAIGGGTTVGRLGAAQGLGEIEVSRLVKELVDAGLAAITDEPAGDPERDLGDLEPDVIEPDVTEVDGIAHDAPEDAVDQDDAGNGAEDEDAAPDAAAAADGHLPDVGGALSASLGELASLGDGDVDDDDAAAAGGTIAAAAPAAPAAPAAAESRVGDATAMDRSSLLKMLSSVRP